MTIKSMKYKECVDVFFVKDENKDIFERLTLMTSVLDGQSIIFFKEYNNKIIGAYVIKEYNKSTFETVFIQVDKNYRSKGIAKELMNEVIKFCKNHNKKIITSEFSNEGEKYIKSQMRQIANENEVDYYISEEEYYWFN